MTAWRGWWGETLLAVVIFAAAAFWGTSYWRASLRAGRMPQFYQTYFEPAVMIACGHGFVISHPQPKPLEDFLWQRADTFSCDQVGKNPNLSTQHLYQGAWRYLMYTVGFAWRWLGISWTRMGPLFGVLFGLTIVIAYGIFRLAMNPLFAAGGAFALSVSTLHLQNLPHLRDYAKAPFTLAAVLVLGLLVKLRPRRSTVVILSAVYGLTLGIGYGFRTDFLIDIPPIFIVLFLFLEDGWRQHLVTKLLGAAAFVLVFLVTAWPILSFVNEKGGGQWHVALLGLTTPFDQVLRIEPAPYDWGHVYDDDYIAKIIKGYTARVRPEWHNLIFGTHEYDLATGAYFSEIVFRFPGDMMTRALASTVRITQLPFEWPGPPIARLGTWLYRPREMALAALNGSGPLWIAAAILAAAAYDLRIGVFLLFFLLYVGGYPALQFGTRHYFHLEFMTWWAMGLLLQGLIRRPAAAPSLGRVVLVGCAAAALAVPLGALRLYQAREARRLFADYVSARKTPIVLGPRDEAGVLRVPGPVSAGDVRFMEIDVNGWQCSANQHVTFQYDKTHPGTDYSRVVAVPLSDAHEVTRIFAPVYANTFQGLVLPGARADCLAGAYWIDPDHRPLLLSVTLSPGWEHSALYQRISFTRGVRKQ